MTDPSPELRASDADREKTVQSLQVHYAEGRLDDSEFTERMEAVYAAKTIAELTPITRDLPARDMRGLPSEGAREGRLGPALRHPAVLIPWTVWAGVSTLNLVIWGIVSTMADSAIYPWWIWVAAPMGVALLFVTTLLYVLGVVTPDRD